MWEPESCEEKYGLINVFSVSVVEAVREFESCESSVKRKFGQLVCVVEAVREPESCE